MCLEVYAQCVSCGEPIQFRGLSNTPTRDQPSATPEGNHAFLPFSMPGSPGALLQ